MVAAVVIVVTGATEEATMGMAEVATLAAAGLEGLRQACTEGVLCLEGQTAWVEDRRMTFHPEVDLVGWADGAGMVGEVDGMAIWAPRTGEQDCWEAWEDQEAWVTWRLLLPCARWLVAVRCRLGLRPT